MDDFTQQEINQAQEVCGGPQNFNCIYDFLATQNEAIANATKKAYETSVEEEKRAGKQVFVMALTFISLIITK